MKVLYIVTAFPRHEGDVITPWLSETIRRLQSRGVEVEVLAPAYRGQPSHTLSGVTVHRFRYAPAAWETLTHDQTAPDRIRSRPLFATLLPGYLAAGSLAAARLARSGRFDVIHAFWPLPHGAIGLAARAASGVPLVSTFFGVELTWARSLPGMTPLLRSIVRRSDAVTAISNYTADLVRRLDPAADPIVIPFGAAVDPAIDGIVNATPEVLNRLLFVGRLVERKGVHVLLRSLALLEGRGINVELDVVGDGPERLPLQSLAESLGISDRVRFHGFVSDTQLAERLHATDYLVLPAIVDAKGDVEGLGVVLLEAMSAGKPVIASRAGGIVDIVEHEVTGLLVPPGRPEALADAIDRYRTDPALARRMAAAGALRVVARFSWDAIIDSLDQLYHRLEAERT